MIASLAVPAPGQAPPCPPLDWCEDVPASRLFGKGYQGSADTLAERRRVFLAGKGLPARVRSRSAIAGLAFGTRLKPTEISPDLIAAWLRGQRRIRLPGLALKVIEGEACATLPACTSRGDAQFLDGLSPQRNLEPGKPAHLAAVARRTAPGSTVATFTAAGASPSPSSPPASPSSASPATRLGAT
jgi:tRNA U34 5-methylaminomethyl-2-thiouridine-forming methyltransferase MnmC